jgi:predicted glycoside hydrolase/deacetylase ChbG (UPF0249 family)
VSETAPRQIWLCADDYGISPAVNRGIRELIAQGRLNATSVMVVGPAANRDEIAALREVAAQSPCAIGLHCTLTAPFHPLTLHFKPLQGGVFLPLGALLARSLAQRIDVEIVQEEIAAQIAQFAELVGRPPDYLDGHQHVQIFPRIREAFLAAVAAAAPHAWVRQCRRPASRLTPPKALLLDWLSARFTRLAAAAGLAVNPGFAGAYDFLRESDFGALLPRFLDGLPDGGLVMCHPGHVDETLRALDPLTDQREREWAFLAGDGLPAALAAAGVALIAPPRPA